MIARRSALPLTVPQYSRLPIVSTVKSVVSSRRPLRWVVTMCSAASSMPTEWPTLFVPSAAIGQAAAVAVKRMERVCEPLGP